MRALALLLLVGCDSISLGELVDPGREIDRDDPGTLIIGRAADALLLDPATLTDNESVETCEQIFEHLVRYSPTSTEVEPALATEWSVSQDGTVWTFQLRPGVTFHDGTPFDADAVVFSFERQRDPRHPFHRDDFTYWQSSFPYIEKIEAIGPLTVRIEIERPYAPFLTSLAIFPVSIVSPTAMKALGKEEFAKHPVGTGPFKFEEWVPGDRIVLERNDEYWGEKAKLTRLVYRYIPDPRQRLVALEGGAVDVAYGILPEELQFVELHPELTLHRIAGQNVAYVAMNTEKPPFTDLEFRRAVNHAVNKVPIVKLVYQGLGLPASGPLPPTMWSWRGDIEDYPFDVGKAKKMVADAVKRGVFDPNHRLTFYVPGQARTYLPNPEQVARVIQRNLADVGIATELVIQDFGSHLGAVQAGVHDLCLLGWQGDTGDPDNFLYVLLDRSNTVPGNARNVAFYKNAELHGLLTYAQETNDRAEREAIYRRAQEMIARDAPWVPLAHNQITVAAHDDVQGLLLHPSSIIHYQGVWLSR